MFVRIAVIMNMTMAGAVRTEMRGHTALPEGSSAQRSARVRCKPDSWVPDWRVAMLKCPAAGQVLEIFLSVPRLRGARKTARSFQDLPVEQGKPLEQLLAEEQAAAQRGVLGGQCRCRLGC